jgi:DNA-binding transcriptional ArsR family regulator
MAPDGTRGGLVGVPSDDLEARAAEAEAFLRSLASRHRLMILCSLVEGEQPAGELGRRLRLAPSNLSRHLAGLRAQALVAARREGSVVFYRIASARVQPILTELCRLFSTGDAEGTQ